MDEGKVHSQSTMYLFTGTARCNKRIHMPESALKNTEIPPQLRRTLVWQDAGKTFWMRTPYAVELKHHMGGTDHPVIMYRIKFNPFAIFQYFRSAHKWNIVIMDDVKTLFQDLSDTLCFKKWESRLLGCQRRKKTKRTFKLVHGDLRVAVTG